MRSTRVALLALALACATAAPSLAAPNVVVSIKPIHALVADVMDGVGTPTLLLPSASSPHVYTLRPSDARALEAAAVVVWIGPELETFLEKPVAAIARRGDAEAVLFQEARQEIAYFPVIVDNQDMRYVFHGRDNNTAFDAPWPLLHFM